MNKLALVIPGLLGPLPELEQQNDISPACPVLQKWLACADMTRIASRNYYALLADLFGINQDYSITRLSALMDGCDCSRGYWLRADPVHFQADLDHAILLDQNRLAIRDYEAQALIASFNRHFHDDGIALHLGHRHRWYLSFNEALKINTTFLHDAIGRNVNHFLPTGTDSLNWKRLLNETQMLFHGHEINAEREAKGELTINSLWLWGEGQAPQSLQQTDWDWVMSNDAVVEGLALWSALKRMPLENMDDSFRLAEGNGIIVLDQVMAPASYGDVQAWLGALENICLQWLEQLHFLLKTKQIQCLELYSADGRLFKLTPASLLKFWRRKKPVTDYVSLQ